MKEAELITQPVVGTATLSTANELNLRRQNVGVLHEASTDEGEREPMMACHGRRYKRMRASHDRQLLLTVCRFMRVRFDVSKSQGMPDIAEASVEVAVLSRDSALQPAKRLFRGRFSWSRRPQSSRAAFSVNHGSTRLNAMRVHRMHPACCEICAGFQS